MTAEQAKISLESLHAETTSKICFSPFLIGFMENKNTV